MHDSENKSSGFTLIEMVMSVAVFTVVALIAAGALLAVADANRKAQAFKSVVNNLHFALESVTRNFRTGSAYSVLGFPSATQECGSEYRSGISFTSQDGTAVSYFLNGAQIVRRVGGGNAVGVTAPEVQVSRFCFLLQGEEAGDGIQPHALLRVGGVMRGGQKLESRFDVQTFMTQRLLDS